MVTHCVFSFFYVTGENCEVDIIFSGTVFQMTLVQSASKVDVIQKEPVIFQMDSHSVKKKLHFFKYSKPDTKKIRFVLHLRACHHFCKEQILDTKCYHTLFSVFHKTAENTFLDMIYFLQSLRNVLSFNNMVNFLPLYNGCQSLQNW